uniref:DDHD domain-containing protein n=1 Tax=Megaselia scalaris TaxID=36166 RepID=T1GQZ7_MEGSC
MLIKEYRIPLPLTVEEYRIAQLYMIAKKSRTESSGQGNGVQILVNEPYQDGPGGNGQYTKKIYHVGQHLPGWIKSLLPENALSVGEEAWNAYPFTKTRYTCPFVEKFSLDIETYYFPDDGNQENVFKLSGSDLRNRSVDVIDIVKDQPSGKDYVREEDPKLYMSEKTRRGPLDDDWLVEYWNEICREGKQPTCTNKSMMCAYKLCRVEFRYWGMQTKLEKFIHETALRKTMLRAHRQAWAWQDEWVGFSMEDIREYERQTQVMLAKKMAGEEVDDEDEEEDEDRSLASDASDIPIIKEPPLVKEQPPSAEASSDEEEVKSTIDRDRSQSIQLAQSKFGSKGALHSPVGSAHSFDVQQHAKAVTNKSNKERVANWRMERLEVDSKSGSEEEFFDCVDTLSLAKWSSLEILGEEEESPPPHVQNTDDSIFNHAYLQRAASARSSQKPPFRQSTSLDRTSESPPGSPSNPPCKTSILILVVHAGSVLDATSESSSKKSDITTFRGAFESVMRQHYPSLLTHLAIKLVQCPSVATDALGLLSSLSPYSFNASPVAADLPNISDVPIGAIPLLSVTSPLFHEAINKFINEANQVFHNFVKSDDGSGFSGQVALSDDEDKDKLNDPEMDASKLLKAPSPRRRRSSSSSDTRGCKLDFEVGDFFMFGSPLALILAARKLCNPKENLIRPHCGQMYNVFHPTDPTAARLEPLLSARFSMLSPVNIPRYAKFPLGNGVPMHLFTEKFRANNLISVGLRDMETIQSHPTAFNDMHHQRRLSDASMQSTVSGLLDNVSLSTISAIQSKWWGTKRLDFALYCPEGLSNFPAHALPHLFHARQAREKWIRKRTSVKLKNMTANHRANDVIALEGKEQRMHARFNYGPLDVMTLAGEKVDIHIMKDPPAGEWTLLSTELSDKNGRISYSIPEDKHLGYGIYPVKMVVRGDHTHVDFFMAVIPPKTECVVFSIDGSFTASMSVTGRDPKVRAGAVDVCRHWQELGYLLIYITGRPDIQQHKVVSWLSQHNFPHGMISFADGLLTDPLGYKTAYLNNLVQNHCILINAAYGSSKDIAVYQNVGLKPSQIYIVGK